MSNTQTKKRKKRENPSFTHHPYMYSIHPSMAHITLQDTPERPSSAPYYGLLFLAERLGLSVAEWLSSKGLGDCEVAERGVVGWLSVLVSGSA